MPALANNNNCKCCFLTKKTPQISFNPALSLDLWRTHLLGKKNNNVLSRGTDNFLCTGLWAKHRNLNSTRSWQSTHAWSFMSQIIPTSNTNLSAEIRGLGRCKFRIHSVNLSPVSYSLYFEIFGHCSISFPLLAPQPVCRSPSPPNPIALLNLRPDPVALAI